MLKHFPNLARSFSGKKFIIFFSHFQYKCKMFHRFIVYVSEITNNTNYTYNETMKKKNKQT